jgi:two-component system sensor histidine kinase AlgZ
LASAPEADGKYSQAYLPDFCAAGTILVILLVAELVAIVLTLAGYQSGTFLTELSKTSMFLLWLALAGTALMCRIRPWAENLGNTQAFVISFILLEIMCLVLAEVTYWLTVRFGEAVIIDASHGEFLMRTLAISSIVIALTMRYLYVSSEWRRSIVLEAQARISALQALIRPHFLFNSMNTIASLTRSDPKQAEEAVEDRRRFANACADSESDHSAVTRERDLSWHRIAARRWRGKNQWQARRRGSANSRQKSHCAGSLTQKKR